MIGIGVIIVNGPLTFVVNKEFAPQEHNTDAKRRAGRRACVQDGTEILMDLGERRLHQRRRRIGQETAYADGNAIGDFLSSE